MTSALQALRKRTTDTARICALAPEPTGAGDEPWIDALSLPGGTMELRPVQRRALSALRRCRGLVGPLGVGSGKTLVCALAPRALDLPGRDVLVLLPPTLIKTALAEFDKYSAHFDIDPPSLLPYSALSKGSDPDVLDRLAPRAVIADEAHYLRHATSARTKRWHRYMAAHPDVVFAALSGTLIAGSFRDAAVLSARALGQRSPLPLTYSTLQALCVCSDLQTRPDCLPGPGDWRQVQALAPGAHTPDALRQAVQERIVQADGVVATSLSSVSMSLTLYAQVRQLPKRLQKLLQQVTDTWTLPDGSPVCEAPQLVSALRQISTGFYYTLDWCGKEPDIQWLHARSALSREMAAFIRGRGARLRLDTPGAVEEAIKAGAGMAPRLLEARDAWLAIKDRANPRRAAVWLDDSLCKVAVRLAGKHNALLWYTWHAVGDRLEQLGIETARAGDEVTGPARPLAVSVEAHGTGRNLQQWCTNVVLVPPVSGLKWEQMLGRTHRQGQEADEVEVYVLLSGAPGQRAFRQARKSAEWFQQATGQEQKLLLATVAEICHDAQV